MSLETSVAIIFHEAVLRLNVGFNASNHAILASETACEPFLAAVVQKQTRVVPLFILLPS